MLCAGVTTYAALRKSGAKSGQWVVISGAGGGLGHIAVQLSARGMAHRVIGVDAGSKKQIVLDSGAEAFVDVTQHDDASISEEVKKMTGGLGASAVIVCTASNKAYAQALDFLRFGGTLVCVGMPEGKPVAIEKAYPAAMVAKLQTITAVAVGNRREAIECLDFAARGVVKTHYRLEKMEKLTEVSRSRSRSRSRTEFQHLFQKGALTLRARSSRICTTGRWWGGSCSICSKGVRWFLFLADGASRLLRFARSAIYVSQTQ